MFLALAGCAGAPTLPSVAASIELDDVPFFPQTRHQCGPAALATILNYAHVAVSPDRLTDEVYVAGLHGSLQPELLAATRRAGLIPYVLEPRPDSLFAELAAGRPVLILQNLGLARVPVWHYAVVVGVDRERGRVILRSGTKRRRAERGVRFLRSWRRGHDWAFVALHPGALPATATPSLYVKALAGAEHLLPADGADAAFDVALRRWPHEELVLFAAASHDYGRRDLTAAAALYRRLLERAPANAAARNNLANVLAEQGCHAAALREARTALESIGKDSDLYASIADTMATLEANPARGPEPTGCP